VELIANQLSGSQVGVIAASHCHESVGLPNASFEQNVGIYAQAYHQGAGESGAKVSAERIAGSVYDSDGVALLLEKARQR
jgi:hypothetical protein